MLMMMMVECHENWLFLGTQNHSSAYSHTVFVCYHHVKYGTLYIKGTSAGHLYMDVTTD